MHAFCSFPYVRSVASSPIQPPTMCSHASNAIAQEPTATSTLAQLCNPIPHLISRHLPLIISEHPCHGTCQTSLLLARHSSPPTAKCNHITASSWKNSALPQRPVHKLMPSQHGWPNTRYLQVQPTPIGPTSSKARWSFCLKTIFVILRSTQQRLSPAYALIETPKKLPEAPSGPKNICQPI